MKKTKKALYALCKRLGVLAIVSALIFSLPACSLIADTEQGGDGGDGGDGGGSPLPTAKYSALLYSVVNDEQYNYWLAQGKADHNYFNKAIFDSHPYAFLEDQGYDVEAIKNGTQECQTMSYVINDEPNNLYIFTRVLEQDHYDFFLIKYTLTKQEMQDYRLLHGNNTSKFYTHAVFINDKISELKTPTIVGKCKYNKTNIDNMFRTYEENFTDRPSNVCSYGIFNIDTETRNFKLIMLPSPLYSTKVSASAKIVDIDCRANVYLTYNNDIYTKPIDSNKVIKTNSTTKSITLFGSQYALLYTGSQFNLED